MPQANWATTSSLSWLRINRTMDLWQTSILVLIISSFGPWKFHHIGHQNALPQRQSRHVTRMSLVGAFCKTTVQRRKAYTNASSAPAGAVVLRHKSNHCQVHDDRTPASLQKPKLQKGYWKWLKSEEWRERERERAIVEALCNNLYFVKADSGSPLGKTCWLHGGVPSCTSADLSKRELVKHGSSAWENALDSWQCYREAASLINKYSISLHLCPSFTYPPWNVWRS